MASGRKSLSDFLGHSWSSWSEYAGNLLSPDVLRLNTPNFLSLRLAQPSPSEYDDVEDNHENNRKGSEVMRLFSSDMEKFGLFPETDVFCAVVCNECGAVVKAQGLLTHMRMRHKGLVQSQSKVSSEKISKHVDSKHVDSKHTEGKHMESKHNESKHNEGNHAEIKYGESPSSSEKSSAKYMLNEKLMSKLALSDKLSMKSTSSEKLSGSPSDKHVKSTSEKPGNKHSSSDKSLLKSSDKLTNKLVEKTTKPANEKTKISGAIVISEKSVLRVDGDKSKSTSDIFCKQVDQNSSKCEKISKIGEKVCVKTLVNDKYSPKYGSVDSKTVSSKGCTVSDKPPARSVEKISAKSILNEKLLMKAAASDKVTSTNVKIKCADIVKFENNTKIDRSLAKPVMKSLLKEKILKSDVTQNLTPGSSILKSTVLSEREALPHGTTSLSPPVLTPQNRPQELKLSVSDMPILSRKRKYRERKVTPIQYDPDRHCGVWCDYFNKFCVRSLTCKAHSVAARRAVVGRSKPFDQLLMEHRRAKEDQRVLKDDQDDASQPSPQLLERIESSSEPSSSSFVGSPYASPISSPGMQGLQGTALCTPSLLTTPPIPSLSYQYPPYPPPLPPSPSLPDNTITLSPHLSSPLLNVALPGLSPIAASNEYGSVTVGKAKIARAAAREINRLQLNKGRQFNIKHGAFPPKPLRTCLFQGRKSSGMFVTQRELEAMRSGFRTSIAEVNKSAPLSHLSLANQSPAHIPADTTMSLNTVSVNPSYDSSMTSQSINSSQVNTTSGLKSVLGTLCAAKTVINPGDMQQRVPRTQKFTILVLTE